MTEVKASLDNRPVVGIFVPLQDFEGYAPDGTLLAFYKKGKRYYIREGNTLLAELSAEWEADSLVELL